jgi:anti-sigma B factor antagonist
VSFELQQIAPGRVALRGRLDAAAADQADASLKALSGPLALDCAQLDYISSAGIGVLIETFKRLKQAGHTMTLVNLLPRVRSIFTYAGLDRVLTIE